MHRLAAIAPVIGPVVALLVAPACTSSASARLQLANHTAASTARSEAVLADGTSLRLKMISVSLAPDVDPTTMDNIGVSANIWLNPECGGDNEGCNIAGMMLPPGPRIMQYFDLSRSTDEVNADLNSQNAPIEPGTYRYARLALCQALGGQNQPTVPGLMWKGPGMTAERPFTSGDCGRTSLAFDPPLVIAAGDAVTVSLGYDLGTSIIAGAPGQGSFSLVGYNEPTGQPHAFRACADIDAEHRDCMDFPELTPSAAKL